MSSENQLSRPVAGDTDVADRFRGTLRAIAADNGIPGISFASCIGGREICVQAGVASVESQAPVTPESRFEISCITKFLVSLVCLRLAADHVLRLDNSVLEYVPDLRRENGAFDDRVLVAHLLAHSSGLSGPDIFDSQVLWTSSWSKLLKYLEAAERGFLPGTVFNYDHSGYVIVGKIIEQLTGRLPLELVREMLLLPLGIAVGTAREDKKNKHQFVSGHRAGSAGQASALMAMAPGAFWRSSLSGWTMSPSELLKIVQWLAMPQSSTSAPAVFAHQQLAALRASWICIPPALATGAQTERPPLSFGAGCARYPHGVFGHNGSFGGQTFALRFDPDRGIAFCVAMNIWLPDIRDSLCDLALTELAGVDLHDTSESSPPGRLSLMCGPFTRDEVVGVYRNGQSRSVEVLPEEDGLSIQGESGGNRFHIAVPDASSRPISVRGTHHRAVGFFADPQTGRPCLSMDMYAFGKV